MFKFKGLSSVDMGVFAKEENFLGKASMKIETITIDGKNGSDIITKGYENFNSSLSNVTFLNESIDESIQWLSGVGELEYNNKKTTIQFHDGYTVMKKREPFSIAFTRSPFWYKRVDPYVAPLLDIITNEGTTESEPIIKLVKGVDAIVEFRVNGTQFKYDFKNDNSALIDCELKNAYYDNLLRNRQLEIGFAFPKLKVGNNTVTKISGDATIEFKRKDVWL